MNKELILRLSKYKRLLQKFKALGLERVFSNNLGDAIGITPALVRKDFSTLQLPGNKRGGYHIDTIIELLNEKLGQDKPKEAIIVGCGKIGTALIQYNEFAKEGISIVAGFDSSKERVEQPSPVPLHHISELSRVVREEHIKVGIIAVPETAAAGVLDDMLQAGIQGVLNFAPIELKCSRKNNAEEPVQSCIVQNVNIGLELENLFYLVNIKENEELEEEQGEEEQEIPQED
jgi:redox-sensing transcriptional repressor